ncbi:MAG: TolC family protein [Gammaproteobacteria bacterium]|nr:TolC family protein [Gammaproteobacteria bacterium]
MKLTAGLALSLLILPMSVPLSAQTMNLQQVIQQVVDHYPSLKVAAIQVERARQENIKVEGQLAWQLSARGGVSRNISLFGTPTDRVDVSGQVQRQLSSGASVSVNASMNREDATTTFSPLQPNPSSTSIVDLSYRHPLAQGSDNPVYTQGREQAHAREMISRAERQAIHDQLAAQIIELYVSAITTQARMKNTRQAIERSQRLLAYINDRFGMGLTEEKDRLQAKAQLSRQQAELKTLQIFWQQQRIALNRLMGRDWSAELNLVAEITPAQSSVSHTELFTQLSAYSPPLAKVNAQIKLADTAIELARDAKKDNLDLLMFVGNQNYSGDTLAGTQSESEVFGGVSLEYQRGLNKSAYDAAIYQAQLDRDVALENKKQLLEDLNYDLASLLAEIKMADAAVQAYQISVKNERLKLKEAEQRYQSGRTDTDQLIQFESQLSQAMLSYELQKIEVNRRYHKLTLLLGQLWQMIKLPDYSFQGPGE